MCHYRPGAEDGSIRPEPSAEEIVVKAHRRKNGLFADTPNGAQASAICYTMVEMAKAKGLNPRAYLQFLPEHRPSSEMSDMELSKIIPWSEDVRRALAK